MSELLHNALEILSKTEQTAVEIKDEPVFALSESTNKNSDLIPVRFAKTFQDNPKKKFGILGLTNTDRSAEEHKKRVDNFGPYEELRTFIGTVPSFCEKIVRQHGSHIGIIPGISVYNDINDRCEVLRDALLEYQTGLTFDRQDLMGLLSAIDCLRSCLVDSEELENFFVNTQHGKVISKVYMAYEKSLQDLQIQDYNSLVKNACRLLREVPILISHLTNVYRFWIIDDFQSFTALQYEFVKTLASDGFRNIFAVANNNQNTFQWAYPNFMRVKNFCAEFKPKVIHFVDNKSCSLGILNAANSLINHNVSNSTIERDFFSSVANKFEHIRCHSFVDENKEANMVAEEIKEIRLGTKDSLAVLGRTKDTLEPVLVQLKARHVKSTVAGHHSNFASPHFNWLKNCLELAYRPCNEMILKKLTVFGNLVVGTNLNPETIIAEPLSTRTNYLEHWSNMMMRVDDPKAKKLAILAKELVNSRYSWKSIVEQALKILTEYSRTCTSHFYDINDDSESWQRLHNGILGEVASTIELAEYLKMMKSHSEVSPTDSTEVRLITVHNVNALEFDHVWMVGMVDGILPAQHSLNKEADQRFMDEERRLCVAGMTCAKKSLSFSYARSYNGFSKQPSRFLQVMGLI